MLRRLAQVVLALPLGLVAFVALAALGNARVGAPTAFETSALRAAAAPRLSAPVTLRVVTFNVADGYAFTNNRRERMRAIARTLRALDPDLVGLQEAFIADDRALLRADPTGQQREGAAVFKCT